MFRWIAACGVIALLGGGVYLLRPPAAGPRPTEAAGATEPGEPSATEAEAAPAIRNERPATPIGASPWRGENPASKVSESAKSPWEVRGIVVDERGMPVEGADVRVMTYGPFGEPRPEEAEEAQRPTSRLKSREAEAPATGIDSDGGPKTVVTDADGRFTLSVSFARRRGFAFDLTATAPGHVEAKERFEADVQDVRLVAPRAGRVAGRVLFPAEIPPADGNVAWGFRVALFSSTATHGAPARLKPTTWTRDGAFAFDAVPPGIWALRLVPVPELPVPPPPWIEGLEVCAHADVVDPRLAAADARGILRFNRLRGTDELGFAATPGLAVRDGSAWRSFTPVAAPPPRSTTVVPLIKGEVRFVTVTPIDLRAGLPGCRPAFFRGVHGAELTMEGRPGPLLVVVYDGKAPATPTGYALTAALKRVVDSEGATTDEDVFVGGVAPGTEATRIAVVEPGEYELRWSLNAGFATGSPWRHLDAPQRLVVADAEGEQRRRVTTPAPSTLAAAAAEMDAERSR
ncbi:MAG TPA: hypothetical protein VEI02_03150 [Planctomycetota bacterium]|nr:hypothetical protein [Planctomycetota bacterium]